MSAPAPVVQIDSLRQHPLVWHALRLAHAEQPADWVLSFSVSVSRRVQSLVVRLEMLDNVQHGPKFLKQSKARRASCMPDLVA